MYDIRHDLKRYRVTRHDLWQDTKTIKINHTIRYLTVSYRCMIWVMAWSHLGGDGGMGHGPRHGDQAVHAAEADRDLEQLRHLFKQMQKHNGINKTSISYIKQIQHQNMH